MAKAKRETYHVRLVRPRFEVQYLTVQATSEDAARAMAEFEAGEDASDWKLIDYSPEDYQPFIERCLSDSDLDANEMTPEEGAEMLSSTLRPERDKYLLMYADTDGGQGELCEQPWLWSEGALMTADLCGDWALGLQDIIENEASEDDLELELQGGEASTTAKFLLAETLRKQPKKDEPN